MSEVGDHEARRRAAAQALIDRAKRESGLQRTVGRLDVEAEQLRAEIERLASESSDAIDDRSQLSEENQQLRARCQQLSESDAEHKSELQRLSQEVERLQGENERVTALMEALKTEINLILEEEAARAEVPSRDAPAASETQGGSRRDPMDDVTDERARTLLNSIVKRL